MIPVALSLGVLIARVATVAAVPRAAGALRAFFGEPKSVERTSTAEKTPQSKTPPAIPATGTKEVVFTANSLNQRTSPGVNVYDAKGQTRDQNGRQFEWDDDGRLTAIVMDPHRSEFSYDGYGRRVRITEKENAVVESDRLYFWVGGEIVCERDALQPGNPVVKRYFGQGVIANGTKLYYTFDQLGSVRELVDAAGEVRADYRYSVYGERTKIAGDLDSDWGWAGLWHHEPSGLDLATYRAYDPTMSRWLSRDPLGEGVDLNLYRYCGNDPVGSVDPSGLDRNYEYFTLFERPPQQEGDSIILNWDLRVSTTSGGGSAGGARLIHKLYVPRDGEWVMLNDPTTQRTGPMKEREVRHLRLRLSPWDCEGRPKYLAIKIITELDGGKKTYMKESEFTIELFPKTKAVRIPNSRTIPEIWQDSWRYDRRSKN